MELYFTVQALSSAALIFALRVTDMSLDMLRILFVMRGRKGIAWVLGFFQSAIFVVAITSVLSNRKSPQRDRLCGWLCNRKRGRYDYRGTPGGWPY